MRWKPTTLRPTARAISASRRTDIPALYTAWFGERLQAGFAEYIPAGPPRRCRVSLNPADVLWFNFWSRWPRPFLPVLERVRARGFPVLFNLTLTALGGTPVEPGAPSPERALAAARDLAQLLPSGALLWRYDPIFLSQRYPAAFHLQRFQQLADGMAGLAERVAISFVTAYGRRVRPDLQRYCQQTGDSLPEPEQATRLELCSQLRAAALKRGITLTVCCDDPLRQALGAPAPGCNSYAWAARVYPELRSIKPPTRRATRQGCACSAEADIGVYDTCTMGCRYSYGSRDQATARARARRHDPRAPCLLA